MKKTIHSLLFLLGVFAIISLLSTNTEKSEVGLKINDREFKSQLIKLIKNNEDNITKAVKNIMNGTVQKRKGSSDYNMDSINLDQNYNVHYITRDCNNNIYFHFIESFTTTGGVVFNTDEKPFVSSGIEPNFSYLIKLNDKWWYFQAN